VLAPEEGFAGFTNPATTTVGAYQLSYALFRSGVLDPLGVLIRLGAIFPKAPALPAAPFSAFINDTASRQRCRRRALAERASRRAC
jgi:hypothetical protein